MKTVNKKREKKLIIFLIIVFFVLFLFYLPSIINFYKSHTVYYLLFNTQIEDSKFSQIFVKYKNKSPTFRGHIYRDKHLNKLCLFRIPYLGTKNIQIFIPNELYNLNDLNFAIFFPDFTPFYSINNDDLVLQKKQHNSHFVLTINVVNSLSFYKPLIFVFKSVSVFIFCILTLYFSYFIFVRLISFRN